jgi:tagaturonate reductase
LFDITLHGTTKMKVRVIPSIVDFVENEDRTPELIAFGFAAFLLFLRGDLQEQRRASGLSVPADEHAARIHDLWKRADSENAAETVARAACGDEALWGVNLASFAGFEDSVAGHLTRMTESGVHTALSQFLFRSGHVPDAAFARSGK